MTLTTEQLRARAKFLREKAVEVKWESVSIAQDMLQNADAFDELAANREAQPVACDIERIKRHALPAGECPRQSRVVLLSSLQRLLTAPPAPAVPDGWIACTERMPDNDETRAIAIYTGKCLGQGMFVGTYDEDGFFDYWEGSEILCVTHWMPLPAAPEGGNG
ncbi:DUF551 domain-containing protein [Serratia sp. IR-2025]